MIKAVGLASLPHLVKKKPALNTCYMKYRLKTNSIIIIRKLTKNLESQNSSSSPTTKSAS